MEFFNNSKICREFLNQYSDSLYPELLPKLMKVAIFALYKTFHKWHFSLQELDEFINFFNYKNRNFELESNINNPPCPPCEEYLVPKGRRIQELHMGYRPPESLINYEDQNGALDCIGFGKYYPNDDIYINDKNNFFDENYYIPKTRSYRNIQLYHRRLTNPKFITQEKKIYPHWWWNLKDDIEQDDYSEDDSEIDHRPSNPRRYPKHIEQKFKKMAKRFKRNQSYSGTRPVPNRQFYNPYDEERIFPNPVQGRGQDQEGIPSDSGDLQDRDREREIQYPRRVYSQYSPSEDDRRLPYGRTASDGFRRTFPQQFDTNPQNPQVLQTSPNPLYGTGQGFGPQTDFRNPRGQPGQGGSNPIGLTDNPELIRDKEGHIIGTGMGTGTGFDRAPNRGDTFQSQNPNSIPNGDPNRRLGYTSTAIRTTSSYTGTDALKSQIINKRNIKKLKQSTLLSFDKDFKLNGVLKKVRGKPTKGLKYSLCGNQLKEDGKGIRRRKK